MTRAAKYLRKMIAVVIILYIALVAYAYFFSDRLIFQPHPASYRDSAEILKLTTSSGKKISAIYLPNNSARYTLLVSHGNAEDLGDDREWLHDLRREGFSVFAFDYEGYGTSEGKPSERALYDDEFAAYDFLAINLDTPPDRILIYGRSIYMAAQSAADPPYTWLRASQPRDWFSRAHLSPPFECLPVYHCCFSTSSPTRGKSATYTVPCWSCMVPLIPSSLSGIAKNSFARRMSQNSSLPFEALTTMTWWLRQPPPPWPSLRR
jgi:hypothetical protein